MIYVCYNLDAFINFKRIFVIFHNHEKQEKVVLEGMGILGCRNRVIFVFPAYE